MLRCLAMVCVILFQVTPLWSADTTETFNRGASDVEMYAGYDGLGVPGETPDTMYIAASAGYGLLPRLSMYFGMNLSADGKFKNGAADLCMGVYGTPVDTDHVDLDLFLLADLEAVSHFVVSPAFELNLDMRPDLALAGLYFNAAFPFQAQESSDEASQPSVPVAAGSNVIAGAYFSVRPGHMLLLEYDFQLVFNPLPAEPMHTVGGLALGYNVQVHERLELINQVVVDLPQNNETWWIGVMIGFIATIM